MKSGTMIMLSVFIILFLVSSVVSFLTFQDIQATKTLLNRKENELKEKSNKYFDIQQRAFKISNLLGFKNASYIGGSEFSDADSIIFFLDTVCNDIVSPISKTSLGLSNLGSESQKIDDEEKIVRGQSPNKNKLQDIYYVKNLITLEDIWEAGAKRLEKLQDQVKSARENLKKERSDYELAIAQTEKDVSKLQESLKQKRDELEETIAKNTESLNEAEKNRRQSHEESLQQKNALADAERQQREQTKKFDNEKKNLDDRIQEIQAVAAGQAGIERWFQEPKELAKVQDIPDGEILYSNVDQEIAYIDLGKAEGILKGMTFDIIYYVKGGRKEVKGKVQVKEVQNNMSKVGIIEVSNKLNPIKQGDKIINPVYDRNRVKYFVIAGKLSQKYSIEQVRRLVLQIGGQVEDKLTPKTDIVVLGEGFANDPIYQPVQERGVETMLESEFLGYLGEIQ